MALAEHALSTKVYRFDQDMSQSFLRDAQNSFKACLEGFEAMSSTNQVAEMKYWIALVKYEATNRGWETFKNAIQALLEAEAGYDQRRNEINISTGINAVTDKQILAKEKHPRDIYRFAFDLCFLEGQSAAAWQWIQNAKARSLSDTLGLDSLVPETLLALVRESQECRELHEREQRLSEQMKSTSPHETFTVGLELRALQEEMRTHPPLRALLDLRQGKAVTLDELTNRMKDLPMGGTHQPIAFVDWYVDTQDDIYCCIFVPDSGKEPTLKKLAITTTQVNTWINEHLHSESGLSHSLHRADNHPNQALRQLDGLVGLISQHVDENVLLALAPAIPLDAIPLHALYIREPSERQTKRPVPLIERNPIVYCSNLTVFLQCCELSLAKPPPQELKSTYMAVYEGTPTENCNDRERDLVYNTISNLASTQGSSATTGGEVTSERIAQDWPTTDHILFHGHCNFSPEDITEQSLILLRNKYNDKEQEQDYEYHDFTVRDVFNLKLRRPLVSLLACGSSQQRIGEGDEPLGLITAFLCAGAGSVIGTLWPVASGTARQFATVFAEAMRSGPPESLDEILDLAVALQQTVRKMRRSSLTRTPYHWAAFVLHGSAFFRGKRSAQD